LGDAWRLRGHCDASCEDLMRTWTKFLLLIPVATLLLGAYAFSFTRSYGDLCEKLGGKWASVQSSCITRSCYKSGTCGYWSNPAARCNRLKHNSPLSEVYFQLGEPDEIKGSRYLWQERKGNRVEAVIENNRLVSLECDK
jgi:hypothetical protein